MFEDGGISAVTAVFGYQSMQFRESYGSDLGFGAFYVFGLWQVL